MNLLITITQGYALRNAETLLATQRESIMAKAENNELTDDELIALGFEHVHFEGIAWEEGEAHQSEALPKKPPAVKRRRKRGSCTS